MAAGSGCRISLHARRELTPQRPFLVSAGLSIDRLQSLSKLFERTRTQLAVMRGVLDIDVTKPQLKPPRIVPRIHSN
jgi:hypothetical protein